MIQAAQLRIGNLVEYRITDKFDDRKEWWEVSEIDADDIHWLSKVDTKDEDFRPIILTEEWFLKFGFVKILNQYKKATKTKPFIILFLENQFQYDDLRYRTNLKHVYQLQNLYFALTNKELTL